MRQHILKEALEQKTGCTIQHTGWPCGSCFFAISDDLTEQDWQALLFYRGDYSVDELDNLPDDIAGSLVKIEKLCGEDQ
jgi:hypothetical protein